MAPDAEGTRRRILEAAVAEFSAVGFAGARVDRMAEASGANKRMIYVYYGDKEGLFAAALEDVIGKLVTTVPITEEDLPGYTGRMFDYLVEHPEALRLSMWRQLERPELGPPAKHLFAEKIDAMKRHRNRTGDTGLDPTDLLVLIQGMATAWLISPLDLLRADGSDPFSPSRIAAHRASLIEAVNRLVRTLSSKR